MERIDPEAVNPPSWFEANPGRAADLAFVVFRRQRPGHPRHPHHERAVGTVGVRYGVGRCTHRIADTIYTATPLHHSSTLLMTLGGAIAGGATIAPRSRL